MGRRRGWPAMLAMLLALIFASAAFATNHGTGPAAESYGGRAVAVDADVSVLGAATVDVTLCDTGPLPTAGGNVDCEVVDASSDETGLTVAASLLTGDTGGAVDTAQSVSSVADLDVSYGATLVPDLLAVTAVLLQSEATAYCDTTGANVEGDSTITDLDIVIAGTTIAVTADGTVNQTIVVDVGTVSGTIVLNEQDSDVSTDGLIGEITVNALHITLAESVTETAIELVVASSHADISCPEAAPPDAPTNAPTAAPTDGTGATSAPTGAPTAAPTDALPPTSALPNTGGEVGMFVVLMIGLIAAAWLFLRPLARRAGRQPRG